MSGQLARRGATVVTGPVVSGQSTTVASRALVGLRKVFFTARDLTDSQQLYKTLYALQQNIQTALRPLVESPLCGANLITNQTFSGGQTQPIYHRLGRPYVGYLPVLDNGNVPSFKVDTLPAGLTTSQAIALTATNPGTYSFLVF